MSFNFAFLEPFRRLKKICAVLHKPFIIKKGCPFQNRLKAGVEHEPNLMSVRCSPFAVEPQRNSRKFHP